MRKSRAAKAASAFLAATAMVAPILSPDAAAHSDVEADDHSRASNQNVIVVTARKVSENLQDVPLAVTAVSGQELERSAVQ